MSNNKIEIEDLVAIDILDKLDKEGIEGYFVGGCVRDAILLRPSNDVDIAVNAKPEDVTVALQRRGYRVLPIGIEHGTVIAVSSSGTRHEITTFRKDVETDGRHARVEFTNSLEEDAKRRDFTINAIYADRMGNLVDPVGGVDDLKKGIVRFIGDPEERIKEDYLRILRFFRFTARISPLKNPDEKSLAACLKLQGGLQKLSVERIRDEFLKILSLPDPCNIINVMDEGGTLRQFIPGATVSISDLFNWITFENITRYKTEESNWASNKFDPIIRLFVLLNKSRFISEFVNDFRLSGKDLVRIKTYICYDQYTDVLVAEDAETCAVSVAMNNDEDVVKYIWSVRNMPYKQLVPLKFVLGCPELLKEWLPVYSTVANYKIPELPVRGQTIIDMGVKEGFQVSQILNAFTVKWVDAGFPSDSGKIEELLHLAKDTIIKPVVQKTNDISIREQKRFRG